MRVQMRGLGVVLFVSLAMSLAVAGLTVCGMSASADDGTVRDGDPVAITRCIGSCSTDAAGDCVGSCTPAACSGCVAVILCYCPLYVF